MPRIPKKIPMRHSAVFPQPMYRSAAGEYNRYNPAYARAVKDELGLEMVQGPDMPLAIENRRQVMMDAQERFEAEMVAERARQAYNRKLYDDAIRRRKEELWRDYYQNNEGSMDAISPRQMKRLDSKFDNRASWQVRGIEDPEDPYGWSEMDEAEFREYYKDAPWRMW